MIGTSGAALVAGAVMTYLAIDAGDQASRYNLFPGLHSKYQSSSDEYWMGAYITYGIGGAALTAGLLLVLLDEGKSEEGGGAGEISFPSSSVRLRLEPKAIPGGGGMNATFRF